MRSSVCVISMLLTSSAFAAIVRKSESDAVAMSVSASGEVNTFEGTEQVSKVQGMLAEVQEMARSGAAPAKDKIKTIKDIVTKELIPDLLADRNAAEKNAIMKNGQIDKCNGGGTYTLKGIADKTETTVDKFRKYHASCRLTHMGKNATMTSACADLDAYLAAISVPTQLPNGRPRDQMVDYTKTMSSYFCPLGPKVTKLDDACTYATYEHTKQKGACDSFQSKFELAFCTWRTQVIDACTNLKTCYDAAKTSFEGFVSDTKTLIKKWRVEYAALKKILCFVDVWLSDNNVNTVSKAQYDKCNGYGVDTSAMYIKFPYVPAKLTCSEALKAVENYPGTPGFVTAEYSKFLSYTMKPTPCI